VNASWSCIIGVSSGQLLRLLGAISISKMQSRLVDLLFAIAPLHIMTRKRRETSMKKFADLKKHPAVRIPSLDDLAK
jgi:hypothetical protein